MGETTFAEIVTAAAGLIDTLGVWPLVIAGAVISLGGFLLRRVKGGVR